MQHGEQCTCSSRRESFFVLLAGCVGPELTVLPGGRQGGLGRCIAWSVRGCLSVLLQVRSRAADGERREPPGHSIVVHTCEALHCGHHGRDRESETRAVVQEINNARRQHIYENGIAGVEHWERRTRPKRRNYKSKGRRSMGARVDII